MSTCVALLLNLFRPAAPPAWRSTSVSQGLSDRIGCVWASHHSFHLFNTHQAQRGGRYTAWYGTRTLLAMPPAVRFSCPSFLGDHTLGCPQAALAQWGMRNIKLYIRHAAFSWDSPQLSGLSSVVLRLCVNIFTCAWTPHPHTAGTQIGDTDWATEGYKEGETMQLLHLQMTSSKKELGYECTSIEDIKIHTAHSRFQLFIRTSNNLSQIIVAFL